MNYLDVLSKKNKHRDKLHIKKYGEVFFAFAKGSKSVFFLTAGMIIVILAAEGLYLKKKDYVKPIVPGESSFLASAFVCGADTAKDVNNNIYRTVKIGDQCWMKENLRVTRNPSGTKIVRNCYDNNINNCNSAGGLYDWDTAMDRSATEGAQGICPDGWHIPRDSEWFILESYLKDSGRTCDPNRIGAQDCEGAGTKLKSGGLSGFDGFLAGYLHRSGGYYGQAIYTFFWSSTKRKTSPESEYGIFGRFLSKDYSTLYRSYDDSTERFSVRCLKN